MVSVDLLGLAVLWASAGVAMTHSEVNKGSSFLMEYLVLYRRFTFVEPSARDAIGGRRCKETYVKTQYHNDITFQYR